MSLTADDVRKIAHLARLGILEQDEAAHQAAQGGNGDQDVNHYVKDLSRMLDLMTQMAKIDTTGIIPMAHPLDQVQRLREDAVTETDQRQLFQSIAPQTEAGLYLVPKVID